MSQIAGSRRDNAADVAFDRHPIRYVMRGVLESIHVRDADWRIRNTKAEHLQNLGERVMSSAIFRSSKRTSLAIAAAAALATPVIADAALAMFIQIPGLPGDSISAGAPKDSSDVLAWSWGLSSSISRGGAGRANLQDLSITKFFGASSPDIFEAIAIGKHFAKATLLVFKTGAPGTAGTLSIKIDMTNVAFTSESTGGAGGEDRITENVSMIFDTITITDVIKNESDCFNAVTNQLC